ncbi:MAG: tetratricopeptide repeat protein [Candidatus Omnitrophica bacterium]|nr:tetratricopeptide repeat protein [Candidatus Omnitrophota bacterium]
MQLLNIEKRKDEEKFILKEQLSIKTASASPFEQDENLILSGDFKSLTKGSTKHYAQYATFLNLEDGKQNIDFQDNQIENALKDLKKYPSNPFLLNNLGLAYLNNREFDKALSVFKQAIDVKPDFLVAILNVAFLHLAKNEIVKAKDIYLELLKTYPDDIRVLKNIGNIYFGEKKLNESREIFKKVIRIKPKDIASRNRLALIHLVEGDAKSSIGELRNCLQIKSDIPAIYNNLGIAYGAMGAFKKSIQAFNTALKLSPYYVGAVQNLSIALKQKGNIQESIELLENFLVKQENLKAREMLARFYLENGQHQKSLNGLGKIISLAEKRGVSEREKAVWYNNMGVVYHSFKKFEEAQKHYFLCIEKEGYVNPIVLNNIIDLFFDLAKLDEVKKHLDIYNKSFGEKGLYLYNLSRYNYFKGEIEVSVKNMILFLEKEKKFAPAYAFLSHICSENLQDYVNAIEVNKEAVKNMPKDMGAINNLAYNYLMNGQTKEAAELLDTVKEINDNEFLIATRGLLNIKQGHITEGQRLYNLASNQARNEFLKRQIIQKKFIEFAKYNFGKGDKEEALRLLEKVLAVKIKYSIYTEQAKLLFKKYNEK